MYINFDDFETALNNAVEAVVTLREEAESIKEKLEDIIESCETIEEAL